MKKTNRDMAQNKEYSCINYKTVEPSLSLKSLGEHFLVGEGTYGKVYRCKLKEQIRNNVQDLKPLWTNQYRAVKRIKI